MGWQWPAIGLALSLVALFSLAAKWKMPIRAALLGGGGAAIVAAIPFFWVHGSTGLAVVLQRTGVWGLAAALFGQVALALIFALGLLMVAFWRDPERVPLETAGAVLSAADGRVLYVRTITDGSMPLVTKGSRNYLLEELTGTNFLTGAVHVIGVEMNFLNVHVNRCPIAGQVRLLKHIEGQFLSLRKDEAPFRNERLTTVIEGPSLSVVVVQVASRLVRRTQSFLSLGQAVDAGQRLGMIRLGSLVAVVLPARKGVVVKVKPGDHVTAGVSVLVRYDPGELKGAQRA